jgi:hypothetical protein
MHNDIVSDICKRFLCIFIPKFAFTYACKRRNTMNNNKKEAVEERCGLASVLHEKNQFYTLTICIMSSGGTERKQAEYTHETRTQGLKGAVPSVSIIILRRKAKSLISLLGNKIQYFN